MEGNPCFDCMEYSAAVGRMDMRQSETSSVEELGIVAAAVADVPAVVAPVGPVVPVAVVVSVLALVVAVAVLLALRLACPGPRLGVASLLVRPPLSPVVFCTVG